MIYRNVILGILNDQFNFDSFLLQDVIGYSERSVRSFKSNSSMEVGSKKFTQFKNRLSHRANKVSKGEDWFGLEVIAEIFCEYESDAKPPKSVATRGMLRGVQSVLDERPEVFELGDFEMAAPHGFYTLSFLDRVTDPFIEAADQTDDVWSYVLNEWPYRVLPTSLTKHYLSTVTDSDNLDFSDEQVVFVLYDAVIAVMACLYLDLARINLKVQNKGMNNFDKGVSEAWSAESVSGHWFVLIRNQFGFETHEQFYEYCSDNLFTHLTPEAVRTSYKRWIKGTVPKLKQWKLLAGWNNDNPDVYFDLIVMRSQYIFLELLGMLRTNIIEHDVDWSFDKIWDRLDYWCDTIKTEISLDEWQSLMTADS